jgi:hypothetical protein
VAGVAVTAPDVWLVVSESTPVYSADDGEPVGTIEPGDSYEVVLVEDGWALVVNGSDEQVWLELGSSVELFVGRGSESA